MISNASPLTKTLVSNTQAAEHFGVHKNTLKRWREGGKLTGIKIGSRIFYKQETIEAFVQFAERA